MSMRTFWKQVHKRLTADKAIRKYVSEKHVFQGSRDTAPEIGRHLIFMDPVSESYAEGTREATYRGIAPPTGQNAHPKNLAKIEMVRRIKITIVVNSASSPEDQLMGDGDKTIGYFQLAMYARRALLRDSEKYGEKQGDRVSGTKFDISDTEYTRMQGTITDVSFMAMLHEAVILENEDANPAEEGNPWPSA